MFHVGTSQDTRPPKMWQALLLWCGNHLCKRLVGRTGQSSALTPWVTARQRQKALNPSREGGFIKRGQSGGHPQPQEETRGQTGNEARAGEGPGKQSLSVHLANIKVAERPPFSDEEVEAPLVPRIACSSPRRGRWQEPGSPPGPLPCDAASRMAQGRGRGRPPCGQGKRTARQWFAPEEEAQRQRWGVDCAVQTPAALLPIPPPR